VNATDPPELPRPRVAIALAARNGGRYIREQILSLLWQEDCEVTVHIRDDGSTDGTQAIVAAMAGEHPGRITLVEDGLGASGSAAQNFFLLLIAMREAACDYVALADQDDIWDARKLSHAIAMLRETDAGGLSANLIAFSIDGPPPMRIAKHQQTVAYDHLFQTASAGCTYVLTRELFALVAERLSDNQPNPDIAHDILIYAVARSHGFGWHHDPAAHVLYRQHGGNLVGSRAGLAGLNARWRLIRSGWYRKQTAMLAPYLPRDGAERRVIDKVARGSWRDRLWLAANARRCRRRGRDAIAFAIVQLLS